MATAQLHHQEYPTSSTTSPQRIYEEYKPRYTSDPLLNTIKKIPSLDNPTSHRSRAQFIRPVESPVLRCQISYSLPPMARRRGGLLLLLGTSIAAGTSLAFAGAQAFDDFEAYCSRIREEREMSPYR